MACRSSGPAGRDSKPVRPAARATARASAAARPPSQQARPLIGTAGKTDGRQQDVSNSAMVITTLSNRGLPDGVDNGCHDNAARRAWIGQTGAIRPLGEQRRRSGLWPTGCAAGVITSASPPRSPARRSNWTASSLEPGARGGFCSAVIRWPARRHATGGAFRRASRPVRRGPGSAPPCDRGSRPKETPRTAPICRPSSRSLSGTPRVKAPGVPLYCRSSAARPRGALAV